VPSSHPDAALGEVRCLGHVTHADTELLCRYACEKVLDGGAVEGAARAGNDDHRRLAILVEAARSAAWLAVRTNGRLKARYHRLVLRFWRLPQPSGQEAGDHRYRPHSHRGYLACLGHRHARLQALGHTVTLELAA
jgi:hypothetical protein